MPKIAQLSVAFGLFGAKMGNLDYFYVPSAFVFAAREK